MTINPGPGQRGQRIRDDITRKRPPYNLSDHWDAPNAYWRTPDHLPPYEVTRQIPKNRWHAFLRHLAKHHPFKWIKPKMRT